MLGEKLGVILLNHCKLINHCSMSAWILNSHLEGCGCGGTGNETDKIVVELALQGNVVQDDKFLRQIVRKDNNHVLRTLIFQLIRTYQFFCQLSVN